MSKKEHNVRRSSFLHFSLASAFFTALLIGSLFLLYFNHNSWQQIDVSPISTAPIQYTIYGSTIEFIRAPVRTFFKPCYLIKDGVLNSPRINVVWFEDRYGDMCNQSPDGKLLLTVDPSGSGDGQLWDAKTGSMITVLRGHSKNINELFFSKDGNYILTSSVGDGTQRIWRRRCPEIWWGIVLLWEFWVALGIGLVLAGNIVQDVHYFRKLRQAKSTQ